MLSLVAARWRGQVWRFRWSSRRLSRGPEKRAAVGDLW